MSWIWITLAVVAALLVVGVVLVVAAPFFLRVHFERFETVTAEARLRWGWGAVTLDVAWQPGEAGYRLRVFGLRVPNRPIDAVLRPLVAWLRRRAEDREPFDWRALLDGERVAAGLRALRAAGGDAFEDPEDVGQFGLDSIDLVVDLLASLGLRARVGLCVGLEDPFALGIVWAAGAAMAGALPPGSFYLEPAFNGEPEDTIQGEAEVSGWLKPLPLVWLGLRFVFLTQSGRRCLRAAWTWWWYPREVAEVTAR